MHFYIERFKFSLHSLHKYNIHYILLSQKNELCCILLLSCFLAAIKLQKNFLS